MNMNNNNNIWKYGEPKELSKPHSQGAGGIPFARPYLKTQKSVLHRHSDDGAKSRWVNGTNY